MTLFYSTLLYCFLSRSFLSPISSCYSSSSPHFLFFASISPFIFPRKKAYTQSCSALLSHALHCITLHTSNQTKPNQTAKTTKPLAPILILIPIPNSNSSSNSNSDSDSDFKAPSAFIDFTLKYQLSRFSHICLLARRQAQEWSECKAQSTNQSQHSKISLKTL